MNNKIIIAIDGYSSCGKSTIAKALAKKIAYIYIDSGAMYRAVTFYFLKHNIHLHKTDEILSALADIHINFKLNEENNPEIYLNDVAVEHEIRRMDVSNAVSPVSAIKEVRVAMVAIQQKLGAKKGIVMDGRDIGTTVFPEAELKIFLQAHPIIRAQRRYTELLNKKEVVSFDEVFQNLATRDRIDSTRAESPLYKASDAIEIDNSNLSKEQQLTLILNLVNIVLEQKHSLGYKQIIVEKYLWENISAIHSHNFQK